MKFSTYTPSADLTSVMVPPSVVDQVLADSWKRARYVSDADESSAAGGSLKLGWKEVLALAAIVFVLVWVYNTFKSKAKGAVPAGECDTNRRNLETLEPIRATLSDLTDGSIKERALEVQRKLDEAVGRLGTNLPPPAVVVADDGALLLEWTKGDRRVGINVEKVAADSGWYFVSVEPGRFSSASGTMADLDPSELLSRLAA